MNKALQVVDFVWRGLFTFCSLILHVLLALLATILASILFVVGTIFFPAASLAVRVGINDLMSAWDKIPSSYSKLKRRCAN